MMQNTVDVADHEQRITALEAERAKQDEKLKAMVSEVVADGERAKAEGDAKARRASGMLGGPGGQGMPGASGAPGKTSGMTGTPAESDYPGVRGAKSALSGGNPFDARLQQMEKKL